MKLQQRRIADLQRNRIEAALEAGIGALFGRCPTLCGFAVRDQPELLVIELSVYPLSDPEAPRKVRGEIIAALLQLIDECPGARELLHERTFARVFH